MPSMMFINLPVRDLPRSMAFYKAIGAAVDERFTDRTAACMRLSEAISVMLLTHGKMAEFTSRAIAGRDTVAAILCLTVDSREAVDDMACEALAAGGLADPVPRQDHGFMYGRSFEDPDGHIWECMWMDVAACAAEAAEASNVQELRL